MFEFNHRTPDYSNLFYKLADALSGFLFTIAGLFACQVGLSTIGYILFAVSATSIVHIFFPFRIIRLIDYSLAVTLVSACLLLVINSGFIYPYAILAATTCGASLFIYAHYQKVRANSKYNIYYYFWHVGALATCILSITAFVQSI
jgi:hypothetical protein